jgi:hypothetical protein
MDSRSKSDEALQRAIADACLRAREDEELARDLPHFLASRGVAPDDIEAIALAPARLSVYRSLVRNGLSSVVLRMLPRTRVRLNAAQSGRFDSDLAAFVDQIGPRSHYLRDVPFEFFAWAEARWRSDARVPAYLSDLAGHELMQFAVASSESARGADDPRDIALDRPLAFVASARIAHYGWAVHELSPDEGGTETPHRRAVHLLAYRDAAHSVRWLELTPLASLIIERLFAGDELGPAVDRALHEHAIGPASVLSEVARLLADLGARGVIVGAH